MKYIIYLFLLLKINLLFYFYCIFYKFALSEVSIIREFNLLKRGNANLLVPLSDVLSAEAT